VRFLRCGPCTSKSRRKCLNLDHTPMIIYDVHTRSTLPKRASPGPYRSRREMSQFDHVNDYYYYCYYYTAKQLQLLTRQTVAARGLKTTTTTTVVMTVRDFSAVRFFSVFASSLSHSFLIFLIVLPSLLLLPLLLLLTTMSRV